MNKRRPYEEDENTIVPNFQRSTVGAAHRPEARGKSKNDQSKDEEVTCGAVGKFITETTRPRAFYYINTSSALSASIPLAKACLRPLASPTQCGTVGSRLAASAS